MHFILKREKIVNLLSKLNIYIKNNIKDIILSNILIILVDKKLHLLVTNLNIEINYIINLSNKEFIKNGSITVNLNKFFQLCKNYPKESYIDINYYNKRLCISCLNIKSYLSTLSSNNFPILNKNILFDNNFIISSNIFKRIIYSIYFSMGNEDIYYYLSGMLIEYSNLILYFVTTDSYRMSIYKLKDNFDYRQKKIFSIIISNDLVLELLKLLNDIDNKNIYFSFNKSIIKIIFDNFIIYSNLIDGNFPDYKNILYSFKKYLFVDIDILNFKNALIRNFVISNNVSNYVTLEFNKNQLLILANDNNNNEIRENIIINNDKNIQISLNIKYILDIVKCISNLNNNTKIRFFLKDSYSIIKIIDIENIYLIYMIMPIQL